MRDDASHESAPAERLRVFLCHASGDKPQVRELHRRLRDDGFEPWLDELNLVVGQHWPSEIERAVRASHVVIVCLSKSSVAKTGFVQKELLCVLEVAQEQPEDKIFILPVRLDECEVPRRLRDKQWANLFEEGGYYRIKQALTMCARDRELFTPEPESENDTRRSAASGAGTAEPLARLPEVVGVRPMYSHRPARTRVEGPRSNKVEGSRSNKKGRSKLLALSGAAVLVAAVSLILGLSSSNGRVESPVNPPDGDPVVKFLIPSETTHPGPVTRPEPQTETTPAPPPATPVPAEPRTEAKRVENDAPPVSAPRSTPTRQSVLRHYRIDIFRTNDSQRQRAFAEEIGRYLKKHAGEIRPREQRFKPVKGCEIRYFSAGEDNAHSEDAAASELENQLNSVYPNGSFKKRVVSLPTPNIISLVIGSDCKK